MKQTITMTGKRLLAMRDNGMSLYWTPGAQAPYWNSQPSFACDICVATPEDFAEAGGFDSLDGCEGLTLSLEVKSPESLAATALGSIKSERKAESSRTNGRKGGRPRKS